MSSNPYHILRGHQPTIKSLANRVGQLVTIDWPNSNEDGSYISITCKILDVKITWNTVRFQVSPQSGYGAMWVNESSTKPYDFDRKQPRKGSTL